MPPEDDNRMSGRMRRYAQVAGGMGGIAGRMAVSRLLGLEGDRGKRARDLESALGGLKGPLMKVAQMMATIPDALPQDYVEAMARLQTNAPAMGWPFVRRRMRAELGPDWQRKFASFERHAAHAASLGQVHAATAHDGTRLACKLQYPDMASVVEADLKQLRLIFALYERGDKGISTAGIHAEIAARLREELDYDLERRHMQLYADMLGEEAAVSVPEAIPDLSTGRLLTMSWLDGAPLLSVKEAPLATRNAVAQAMFRAWYVPFYRYGVIHGDPHLGNYTLRPDNAVNLLDFGCIRVFPPGFVKGVIDLYGALRDGDKDAAVAAYEGWGFRGISKELVEVLNIWAEFVYAPLLKDDVIRIQEQESGLYGAQVAGRVHRELRRIGGVAPPREFVFMDRAAIGLGSVFMHLKAEINWHRLFHGLIDDFDVAVLTARQAKTLDRHSVPLPVAD
jgi:predicted unusual protein kinase regulating ubiquinone biosynthesis (AarF/ABC1/UbiB family)